MSTEPRPVRLVLVRHGEIVHPGVSSFDEAVLSEVGKAQMRDLAAHWPYEPPAKVFSSTLPRAVQSATILSEHFGVPLRTLRNLREWSPSYANITEEEYLRREEECWNDLDQEFETGESVNEAMDRVWRGMTRVVEEAGEGVAAVVGHAMTFTIFLSSVRNQRPDIEYKRRIKNSATAVVEHDGGRFSTTKDFF